MFIPTDFGNIHAFTSGDSRNQVILAMHGDGTGNNHEKWLAVTEKFSKKGMVSFNNSYFFASLSMPGYGLSSGKQSSFRNNGTEILLQIMDFLKIEKIIVMGRSVGGRTSIEFAYKYPQKTLAVVLQHPVVPQENVVQGLKQVPTILSWAKDDGTFDIENGQSTAGHPYFGPHGAAYVKNLGNCEMLSWNECDYIDGPREFYQTIFVDTVTEFLKRRIK